MPLIDAVNINDPCAVISALKKIRLRIIAGESEVRVRFGDDDVSFKSANLNTVDAEIARLEPECAAQEGRPAKSTRRAFSARF